jgi:predicted RNA binding protein YcfA (HicA-like mRNA interferase family)
MVFLIMATLGAIKLTKIIKLLEKRGYRKTRQKGSHAIYVSRDRANSFTVALGRKDAQDYLIRQMIRAFRITKEELQKLLEDI